MNPKDLQAFAATHLEPRLPWLTRRDRNWAEPSAEAFVCPVEFVHTPIEWIRCSLALISPPANLEREKFALVGFRFVALWRPGAEDFDIGVKRGHGFLAGLAPFRHRWPIGPGAGDSIADDLAAAAKEQWDAAFAAAGSIADYVKAVTPNAEAHDSWVRFTTAERLDVGWLETLAYGHLLMGDPETAHECIVRLRNRDVDGLSIPRANQIDREMAGNPATAVDRLYEWRREQLEADGMSDLAAPRGFARPRVAGA